MIRPRKNDENIFPTFSKNLESRKPIELWCQE